MPPRFTRAEEGMTMSDSLFPWGPDGLFHWLLPPKDSSKHGNLFFLQGPLTIS